MCCFCIVQLYSGFFFPSELPILDEPPISNKNADTEVDEEEYWIPDTDLEEEQLQEKKEKTGKVS